MAAFAAHSRRPPRACDGVESAGELCGVEPALVDLPTHGVHVGPGAKCKQRIALTRRISDRRVGLESQQATRELRVHLAQTRRTPETLLIRGRVASIVEDPAHRILESVEAMRESIPQLGQRSQQLLSHAVVCSASRREDECEIAADRLAAKVNALSGRCAVSDVLACALDAALQRLFIPRDQNQPCRSGSLRRITPGCRSSPFVERLQNLYRVTPFKDVQLRRPVLGAGRGLGMLDQVGGRCICPPAVHGCHGHARRSRQSRQPGPAIRKPSVMNRQRGRDQMEKARGRVRVSPTLVQAPDLAVGAPFKHLAGRVPLAVFGRAALFSCDDRVDAIAVTDGILEPLEDHCHRGIAGNLRLCRGRLQTLTRGRDMNRLARQVDRPDERCVELMAAQGAHRHSERLEPGALLCRDRAARSSEVQQTVQPVGDDVRHRADDAGGLQNTDDAVTSGLEPVTLRVTVRTASRCGCPLGDPPARAVPSDLGIGPHADVDARPRPR